MVFERLEDRRLLSADAMSALLVTDPSVPLAPEPLGVEIDVAAAAGAAGTSSAQTTGTAEQARGVELVFLDPRVPQPERLIADVLDQSDGQRDLEVVVIDPSRDGVEQISQTLAGRTGVDAIHLVTHGAAGQLQLGTTTLDSRTLPGYAESLTAWGRALSADADLLLYGCDVAAGSAGDTLITELAQLTGADVTASIDRHDS